MEIKYDSFSWKDVYLYWQLKTNDLLNCVNQPIPCKKIRLPKHRTNVGFVILHG